MKANKPHPAARLFLVTLFVAAGAALVPATVVAEGDGESGTIKVHDGADAQPDMRNEPHVDCDFWVEGFNMAADSGTLTFFSWRPTGDMEQVKTADWDGTAEADGKGFHFLEGPFMLPDGHYKVESTNNKEETKKSKVFWVECEGGEEGGPGPGTTTAPIPVFPTPAAIGLASLLGVGGAFLVLRRRR